MTRVTRRYRFAASHRLHSERFSGSENRELYGKCNNPHGHGHDYVLEVRVAGPLDGVSGQVVNVSTLDSLVASRVIHDFDHKYMNADVGEFQKRVPTSENILGVIEERLAAHWHSAFPGQWPRLEAIRLRETARNLFELRAS
ncbi:MAG TPA: 6-carboxytetrahydropterin synthase [Bryobacteraceae bacterium]|jgi:6-pyruvoyltetrahydropterin/6-carboxytetrahydropterin synthase|nr:6-carboxytetrahydropterin synthase [Bryobacteraceae bacterium]